MRVSFLIKLKKRHRNTCFPVNFAKFLTAHIFKNIYVRLLHNEYLIGSSKVSINKFAASPWESMKFRAQTLPSTLNNKKDDLELN